MADELGLFWVHTTSVRTFEGSGPFGETYTDPQDVPCFIDSTRKLVRDQTGREVVAEATIQGPVTHAAKFTPESLTTINGAERTVLTVSTHYSGSLGLPDHFEVTTT